MGRKNSIGIIYTFRAGDNLFSVSRRYNTTIAAISRENPLVDIYNLKTGDEIVIPVMYQAKNKVVEYTVRKNDTIQNVLTRFHIELDDLLRYNDLENLKLSQGMLLYIPTNEYDADEGI